MKLKKGQKVIKPKKTNKLNKKAENDKKLKMAKSVMEMYEKKDFPVEKQNGKKKAENTIKEIDNNPEKEQHVKPQKNKRQLKKVLGQEGLLVKHEEGVKWYSYQFDKTRNETEKLNTAENAKLLEEGREILAQDSALLQTHDKQDNASEAAWLYSVLTKGTAADKRTAMQLQMHKSPVHSLEYVEKLVSACTKQGARDVVDIIPILEDIFLNHCLPENRKLVVFSKRPIDELTELSSGNLRSRKKILMLWAFEHELKLLYQKYIDVLVNIVKKPLEELGKRALKSLATCLATRPESEELLLSSLVNTFGHPNYKIGSYVIFLMEDLIRKHPAMKSVVVEEIERLIFRKNVNDRALLYSTTFLSQMKFSQKDGTLCCHLMKIYLSLFKTIVGKKITDTRILPIVLSGANRAFPYAKEVDKLLEDVNDVYYLAHNSNFRTAIPALKLLFQFHKMNDYITDRFYSALYRKLLDNCPAGAYAQLLKLLFDTIKDDPSAQRVRSFVKRLLQVAVNVQAEFAASILLLISKIKKLRKNETLVVVVKDADPTAKLNEKLQANDDEEDDEEKYVDLDNEGNEILPGKPKTEDEINNDEVIVDNEKVEEKKVEKGKLGVASNDGWVHRKMLGKKSSKSPYDTDTRNPLYVDASQCADNELLLLANHYHPSVAVFAKTLLHGGEISYGGDALTDLTLMSFLDRFAFRNPKEISKTAEKRVVRKKQHDPWGVRKLLVKSEEYTKKRRDEIPADERFLHRYTSILNKEKMGKPEKKEEDEWDYAESVNSEEFDAIMERFEPGELNEEFDIDYSKEFSSEKNRRKKDVTDEVDIDEDDDLDDLDDDEDDDDGNEQGNDDDDDDEDDDDDDDDDDDEEEDEDGKIGGGKYNNIFEEDEDSSDDDIRENDYELAGDKFGEMLEDLEDEEESKKKKKGQKRGGKGAGPKSKKPRRR